MGAGRAFDCVNFGNVLEHVREPVRLLNAARRMLKPGGLLRVAVPNDFSRVQKALLARG
jgi:2-polyprenyl-3-methyl-5-hydroxy-6-metoxy-1,4-benzoquinol methylase